MSIIYRRPVASFCIMMIAGILAAYVSDSVMTVAGLFLLLLVCLYVFPENKGKSFFISACMLVFYLFGAFEFMAFNRVQFGRFAKYDGERTIVRGYIASEPEVKGEKVSYIIETIEIKSEEAEKRQAQDEGEEVQDAGAGAPEARVGVQDAGAGVPEAGGGMLNAEAEAQEMGAGASGAKAGLRNGEVRVTGRSPQETNGETRKQTKGSNASNGEQPESDMQLRPPDTKRIIPGTAAKNQYAYSKIKGKILLSTLVNEDGGFYDYGSELIFEGVLNLPKGVRNPGGFNYRGYLAQKGVGATVFAYPYCIKILEGRRGNILVKAGMKVRERIVGVIEKSHPRQQAGLLNGMLIGYKKGLSEGVQEAFGNAGLLHVVAVSGANVAFLVLPLSFIFKLLRIRKRMANILIMIFLFFFLFITGFEPSVFRAVIMASVILASKALYREPDTYAAIAVSCMVQLAINPCMLFNIGFQLSYMATLGIVMLARNIEKTAVCRIMPGKTGNALAVTLAAQLGVLPVTLIHFNKISVISLIPNILAAPMLELVTVLGMVTALLGQASLAVSRLIGYLNCIFLNALLYIAKLSSEVPFATLATPTPTLVPAAVYYVVVWYYLWYRPLKDKGRAPSIQGKMPMRSAGHIYEEARVHGMAAQLYGTAQEHDATDMLGMGQAQAQDTAQAHAQGAAQAQGTAQAYAQGAAPAHAYGTAQANGADQADVIVQTRATAQTRGMPKVRRAALLLSVAAFVSLCVFLLPGRLEVTFLDVGQGDSAFIRTYAGAAAIIDGGGSQNPSVDSRIGETTVIPFLLDQGAISLDAVIATHPHGDHTQGLEDVLKQMKVKRLIIPHISDESQFGGLLQIAAERGVPVSRCSRGDIIRLDDRTEIRVLSPEAGMRVDGDSLNDASLVLKLCYGETSILFTGDASFNIEEKLLSYASVPSAGDVGQDTGAVEGGEAVSRREAGAAEPGVAIAGREAGASGQVTRIRGQEAGISGLQTSNLRSGAGFMFQGICFTFPGAGAPVPGTGVSNRTANALWPAAGTAGQEDAVGEDYGMLRSGTVKDPDYGILGPNSVTKPGSGTARHGYIFAELEADVLKIAHHGSPTSTGKKFLAAVSPEAAIISVGKNNFGHPSRQVLDLLGQSGIKFFRTDECGAVLLRSDGKTIRIRRTVKERTG